MMGCVTSGSCQGRPSELFRCSVTGADRLVAGQGLQLLAGQLGVLEYVAHCVQHSWPCLLVGGHGTGKWFTDSEICQLPPHLKW